MSSPLVSIIIPTYKRPELLTLTLQSIEAQSFTDYEVWVIDDGSPGEANEQVCAPFKKVHYLKIENSGGAAHPRNVGIDRAKGTYIAFVDDDDLWPPHKLEQQVALLETHPDYGLVHGYCTVIDAAGTPTGAVIGRPGSPEVKHGDVKGRMAGQWTLMTPTVLLRKEVVAAVGYFNTQMAQAGEDTEYWTRCSFHTLFYYLDESLAYYRKHTGSSVTNRKHYIDVPLHLQACVTRAYAEGFLTKAQHKQLKRQLVIKQLKGLREHAGGSFLRLFRLDPFWFLTFGNLKVFVKVLLKKRN